MKSEETRPELFQYKAYREPSVFAPENLLREARRQKGIAESSVPPVALLDPDGDFARWLQTTGSARRSAAWACYHSKMYAFEAAGYAVGAIPLVVGASYAALVAEQLFVSGCQLLISVASAGALAPNETGKTFALITRAIRDEGTSYHYLPPEVPAALAPDLADALRPDEEAPYFAAQSWTTDAPYRETASAVDGRAAQGAACVEMEAAALYAFAQARRKPTLCFAHITNTMARDGDDFEKGEDAGARAVFSLLEYALRKLAAARILPAPGS